MKKGTQKHRTLKRTLALLLAVTMLVSVFSVTASAAGGLIRSLFGTSNYALKTHCDGTDYTPTIIIPGISQSRVWLLDENGNYKLDSNGERINCFPGVFDIESILQKLSIPLAMTLATQRDMGFSDALADAVEDVFKVNQTDNNARNTGNFEVEKYWHSVAECTEDQKEYILQVTPVTKLFDRVGEDHVYFFAYNSFGNIPDEVDELYEFIQMVKAETGHDKINLVPISMGGALTNGLIQKYPTLYKDVAKITFVVPALNGSTIVSDILKKELTFLDMDYLYNGFLEELMSDSDAATIEMILRLLPDEIVKTSVEKAVDRIIDVAVVNCTSMWALCPKEEYPALAKTHLSSSAKREVKRQTEWFYLAQCNSVANLQRLRANGVQIFDIVNYDVPLYNVGNSWNTENADGIIPLRSTSMGAYSANVKEQLPKGYTQKNTYCADPTHNHISPERTVDASTGAFPDTTFYFRGQNRATTGWDDIIMTLATDLTTLDTITDVYSDPNYPQFNVGRETADLRNELLPIAKSVDTSTLSAEDAAELAAAIAEAEAMLDRTIGVEGEAEAVTARLRAILEKIGAVEPVSESTSSPIVRRISDWFYEIYGSNGFSEIPGQIFDNLFGGRGDNDTPSEEETTTQEPETEPETKNPAKEDAPIPQTGLGAPAMIASAITLGALAVSVSAVAIAKKRREED